MRQRFAAAERSARCRDIASTADPVAWPVAVVALLIALGILVLLVLVLVGIHNEERHMSLTRAPRTRIGAMTRHLTGVGVRTPEADPCKDQDPDSCPGRHLT